MQNRRRLIAASAAVAVAVAVIGALVSAGVASGARSCADGKGRVLVLTNTGRITSIRGDGFRTWYACSDRSGRRVFLGVHDPTGAEQLGSPRLAGSYAAFERFMPSTGTTGPTAVLVDLAARRRWELDVPGDITGMVLSRRGDLVVTSAESVLHLRRGSLPAMLDVGAILPSSLALSPNGRYVYWQNAGQPRVFELSRGRRSSRRDSPQAKRGCSMNHSTNSEQRPSPSKRRT